MKNDFNNTAIQQLIIDLKMQKLILEQNNNEFPIDMMQIIINIANRYLQIEKDQLNVSFISGCIEALSYHTPVRDRIKEGYFEDKAEQYFNYTYNKNDNETNF